MYQLMKINDALLINPPEKILPNCACKKVPMDCVDAHIKRIKRWHNASFNGGSKFRNGDTIMARITPCLENGKVAQVDFLRKDEVCFGSTEFIVFRGKDKVTINDFVYYVVTSSTFRQQAIASMTGSTGRQRVQVDILSDKKVYIPSIPIQKRIVQILSPLDSKIDSNIEYIETLKTFRNLLYHRWFHRDISDLPSDWKVKSFASFLIPSTTKIGNINVPIYSATNNGISLREEKFNKVLSKSTKNNKMVVKDDLIFGLSREILNFGVFKDEIGSVSPAYQVFKIDTNIILPNILELEIRTNMYKYMDILQLGAREGQGIRKDYLLNKLFDVPPMELQLKFEEIAKPIEQKIVKLKEENEVLAEIRDTLLPKLMSGEIPVEVGEENA